MNDRRVTKHRPTLNDRRGTAPREAAPASSEVGGRTAAVSTAERSRVSEDLIRLACLWQAGALSDAEFEDAKSKVLTTYWKTQRTS